MKIKRLSETAILPTRGSKDAAGLDLYADISHNIVLVPGHTEKIPTNIAIEVPEGYFGGIYARSGLATKQGLRPSNCVGVVDADFRSGIIVALYNDSQEPQEIRYGDRIAQLIIQPYKKEEIEEVDELNETERGGGGFGSTGR